MTRIYAIAAAAVLAALLGGLWLATVIQAPDIRFAGCRSGQIAGGSDQIGGSFELVNSLGETVTEKDVLTGPSLIYFGYTFCPDICPLDTVRNADAVDILDRRGYAVTPVFITVDPQRDTAPVIGEFAANLHERMIGLTGSAQQIRDVTRAYKVYYKAQPASDDLYLVDHSTFSYLVLPEHGFVEFFRRDLTAKEVADRVACFLDSDGR